MTTGQKNGTPVNDPPVGLTFDGAGYISGLADNSEAGLWTFDVTVYDTSIPTQMTETTNCELDIKLKLSVPTNYPTIQAAVDAAENGQTVYLEAGTFQGAGNRDVNFNGKSLTILGDPQDPTTVVIDCEGTSSSPHRGFILESGEKGCFIDGVTIKNGFASVISSYRRGGAIYLGSGVEMTVQNCIIESCNTESQSSGVYGGIFSGTSNVVFNLKSTQVKDSKISTQYGDYLYGGIMFFSSNCTVNVEDSTFTGMEISGGYYLYGNDFFFESMTFSVKNSIFAKNIYKNGYYYHRGWYLTSCTGFLENVYVVNNKYELYSTSTGYFYGPFNYTSSCTLEYKNCVYANNELEYTGTYSSMYHYGWFYMSSGSSKWVDCVLANNVFKKPSNSCYLYAGTHYLSSHTASFTRCHFIMNEENTPYTSTSYSYAGGVKIYSSASGEFNDCVFAYNKAGCGSAAISSAYSSANTVINNTTFYKNESYAGGALFSYGNVTVNNSIMWGNSASYNGSEVYVYSSLYNPTFNNSCYTSSGISGTINPVSCITTDPFFKETGDIVITGDCTFSDATMTVTGTPGTSVFLTEVMRGDMIYLTSDGESKAVFVTEVVSDSELKVASFYPGTPGTGPATVKKMDFNIQHTSDGDANDSPCVDSGDNSKVKSAVDIAGNTRIVDGNGNSTPTVDMGAYENQ